MTGAHHRAAIVALSSAPPATILTGGYVAAKACADIERLTDDTIIMLAECATGGVPFTFASDTERRRFRMGIRGRVAMIVRESGIDAARALLVAA